MEPPEPRAGRLEGAIEKRRVLQGRSRGVESAVKNPLRMFCSPLAIVDIIAKVDADDVGNVDSVVMMVGRGSVPGSCWMLMLLEAE